jgi:uncharacterized protein (TIGR02246 family)
MQRIFLGLCALAVLGSSPAWAQSAKESIEAANAKFAAAFNRGDAGTVASLYTSDAALLPPGAARVDGRPAIERYWKGAIDAGFKNITLEAQEITETLDGSVEIGRFTMVGPVAGGTVGTVTGKYAVLWRRGEDGWRLHRDIWNTDPGRQN